MGLINTALGFPLPLLSTDLIIAIDVAGKVHRIRIICFAEFKENTHRSYQYESIELCGKKLRIKILFREIVPPSHYALSGPGQEWRQGHTGRTFTLAFLSGLFSAERAVLQIRCSTVAGR